MLFDMTKLQMFPVSMFNIEYDLFKKVIEKQKND